MIPNNTNYDTLQVYFDYLEDNNVNTQELRESLALGNNDYLDEYDDDNVGTWCPNVYVANIKVGFVGTTDTYTSYRLSNTVGGGFSNNVGDYIGEWGVSPVKIGGKNR